MRKSNSSMLFWLALLSVVLVVPGHAGAVGPMTSSESSLDRPLRVASVSGVVPLSGTGNGANMLQFKAGGHILGFQPNKVYLAGLDHALSVEFLGTEGVMPTSGATGSAAGNAAKSPALTTVVYRNLWDGIDLTYESAQEGIAESTYRVAPGADPSRILLRYNVPVELQGDGSLRVRFERGTLTESPPVAWQEIEGSRVPVTAQFRVSGNEVGFLLGPYDRTQALVIDPTLAWHTFYGSGDQPSGIAVDGTGNVYVAGDSGATWGSPLNAHSGGTSPDIFVLKLDSSGTYQWHTFYGSGQGGGIAVDTSGNVYVTGLSFYTWGSPLQPHSGSGDSETTSTAPWNADIVVLKLDSNGAYQWHTFYGSTDNEDGRAIAVDTSGNVYVTGQSSAWGSPLNAHSGSTDIFVLKLDSSGAYQWHTFYGSTIDDYSFCIAVDGTGNVYVAGDSGATWGSPLNAHSGDYDIVVLKLNAGGAYQWHTFYGSGQGEGIAVDTSGNVYVTGESYGTWGSPLNAHSGGTAPDIFVLKLDSSGTYQWHTFYGSPPVSPCFNWPFHPPCPEWGGNGYDLAAAIAVDGSGNVYVTGTSVNTWGSPLHAHNGLILHDGGFCGDIFLLKLDNSGAYRWHTFYGSSDTEGGKGIAVDGAGNIYVTGTSHAPWGSPLHAYSGLGDIFVLKMAQPAVGSVDFDGDARNDILWRHTGGAFYLWQMDGLTAKTLSYIPPIDPSWQVNALGDFNGDGTTDTLWRHTGGMLYTWMMNGATAIGVGSPGTVDPSWSVLGAADFGGDGKADLLWRHTGGAFYLWEMNGVSALKVGTIPSIDVSWQVKALADFNGDGKADILWRHTSGMLYLWLMDGATAIGVGSPGTVDLSWTIAAAADFNGDSKADILWRDTSGAIANWQMDGTRLVNWGMLGSVDPSWSVADAHDFNGDGKADILWRHTSGATSLWLMNGFTRIGEGSLGVIDPSWKIENQ